MGGQEGCRRRKGFRVKNKTNVRWEMRDEQPQHLSPPYPPVQQAASTRLEFEPEKKFCFHLID
jgi:hypothetical protein